MTEYTDYQRKEIAEKQYDDTLNLNSPVTIGDSKNKTKVGTLHEVVTDEYDQKAYVIQSSNEKNFPF